MINADYSVSDDIFKILFLCFQLPWVHPSSSSSIALREHEIYKVTIIVTNVLIYLKDRYFQLLEVIHYICVYN